MSVGARSFLDFRVEAVDAGPYAVSITYAHASPVPLDVGFAVDRAQVRTVRLPPLAPAATCRTVTIAAELPCGAAVIRVAEGTTGACLHLQSLRIARRRAADAHGAWSDVPADRAVVAASVSLRTPAPA